MTFAINGAGAPQPTSYSPQADLRADTTPTATAPAALATTTPYTLEPSYNPTLAGILPTKVPDAPGAGATTFADSVAGQKSQPIDLDLMELSNAAYDPSVTQVGKWNRVDDAALQAAGIDPALLETPETGFRAGIYTDGDGHYVLAYSGSNELKDWTGANFPQGLGLDTKQYDQAAQLAQLVANSPFGQNGNLVITGHSLGGGLAATGSLATGVPAVTFDASGVSDNTMKRLGLDPAAARANAQNGQIRRYHVDGDPLTAAQEDTPGLKNVMPDAPGYEITLKDPLPKPKAPDFTWNPIEMAKREIDYAKAKLAHTADMHRQGTMIKALEEQQPWNS